MAIGPAKCECCLSPYLTRRLERVGGGSVVACPSCASYGRRGQTQPLLEAYLAARGYGIRDAPREVYVAAARMAQTLINEAIPPAQ